MGENLTCLRASVARTNRDGVKTPVLHLVDATFCAGAVSLVRGVNGAGKSTLIHLLGGLLRPSSGQVCWGAQPVSRWSARHRDRWRQKVGIAFQDALLLEDLTALENVVAPLIPGGFSIRELRKRGLWALDRIGAADLAREPVAVLSGGQRQRVCFARAVVTTPALLLADEPTNHQDTQGARLIEDLLTAAAKRGATVVVTAQPHDHLLAADGSAHPYRIEGGMLQDLS